MKAFMKLTLLLASLILITSCVTTGGIQVPNKYALDNQLEQVKGIYMPRIIEWEHVDNQSLIINTAPSDYYLIVLTWPSSELQFGNRIWITHTGGTIKAGLDSIIVYSAGGIINSYVIDRIYRINGVQQMRAIKNQLMGEKGTEKGETKKQKILNNNSMEI